MKDVSSKKTNEYGIGLIEVIAALGITIMVITALVSLALFTLRSSLNSKLLLEGTKLANQEVELLRAYRDTVTWDEFTQNLISTSDCENNSCYVSITGGAFAVTQDTESLTIDGQDVNRYFTVTPNAESTILRVAVTVEWTVGEETRFTQVHTDLSSWREAL